MRTSFLRVSDSRQYEPRQLGRRALRALRLLPPRATHRRPQHRHARRSRRSSPPTSSTTTSIATTSGSSGRRTRAKPLPYNERDVRKIVWYTTPELPAHLVEPAMDVVGEWNDVLMETVRKLRGQPLPHYPDVECQTEEPDGVLLLPADPSTDELLNPTCAGTTIRSRRRKHTAKAPRTPTTAGSRFPKPAEPDLDKPGARRRRLQRLVRRALRRRRVRDRAARQHVQPAKSIARQRRRGQRAEPRVRRARRPALQVPELRRSAGHRLSRHRHAARRSGDGEDDRRRRQHRRPGARRLPHAALLETYDLVHGTIVERDITVGEDVRGYFENLGHIDQPARPRAELQLQRWAVPRRCRRSARAEIDSRMQTALQAPRALKGPEGRRQRVQRSQRRS